jgi:outer membrane protein TolC
MHAEWAKSVAGFEAEVRYVEAAGVELVLRSLDVALEAAEANLALVSARAAEGMVTDADVLRARAEVERTRARRIVADQAVADARARLALALGWSPRVVPVPDTDVIELGTHSPVQAPEGRADLAASDAGVLASTAAATAANRARLPTIRGFAKLETHSDASFESRGDSWTVGVRVSMPLFTGFALGARRTAARAELEAASLEHERRFDEARAALAEARRGAESLRQAALAAEAASAAGREAARLMRLRYEEGLTTTAELLATESAAVEQETAAIRARLDHRIAVARLLLLDDPRLDTDTGGGVDR